MLQTKLDPRSYYLRRLIVEALEGGGRGHVGPSMSLVEILRVFYDYFLRINPSAPYCEKRDRLILSKGHGCLALYALLADKGFFPLAALKTFCHESSILGGHPERGVLPGVEASTGSLGHGLPIGVGLSLASRALNINFRTVVITGDGELNEGSNWEAAMIAAKHRLSNLTLVIDCNRMQIWGPTSVVLNMEPLREKLTNFGFCVRQIDGHDVSALKAIIEELPFNLNAPSAIICKTVKGMGLPFAENNTEWHYRFTFSKQEIAQMYTALTSP